MDAKLKTRIYLLLGMGLFAFMFWILWDGFLRPDSFDALPRGGTASTERIIIEGQEREIMVTDDVKHSIPFSEIISGGPAKDGIPSIDDPKFISVTKARDDLDDDDPGLALSIGGTDRFYPYEIFVHHEIVNDTFDGRRVLVTYCPLCATGIVFDPLVDGERVEFGTSGRLWQSNLLMYDRKTDSLWSQILGEAVVGEMTGQRLAIIPSDIIRFGEWRNQHPQGEVLSRDTGSFRLYGRDPYGNYYTNDSAIFFPVSNQDNQLPAKDMVLGIVINGSAKAYSNEAIKAAGTFEDVFADKTIIARWNGALKVAQLFERLENGEEVRLEGVVPSFWFSWIAVHPGTDLYVGSGN